MAKNYMQDVARMLGVELGEEFKWKEVDGDEIYYGKLTEKGFMGSKEDGTFWSYNWQWEDLLTGAFEIEKLSWQPKEGDRYYFPATDFRYSCPEAWDNHPIDFALKEAGMIFKTKEECEAALPELRKKYLGGDKNG